MQWHEWLSTDNGQKQSTAPAVSVSQSIQLSRIFAARMLLSAADSMALTSYELPADWKTELGLVDPYEPQDVLMALRRWLADSYGVSAVQDTAVGVAVQAITERFELGKTQALMVLLAWLIQADHALTEMLGNIRVHDLEDGIAFIGRCFNQPASDYAFIVDETNDLWSLSLLERTSEPTTLAACLRPGKLLRRLHRRCRLEAVSQSDLHRDIDRELAQAVGSFRSLDLPKRQFSYVPDLEGLLTYLQQCLERKLPGRNILIYGPAGTGKTSLVSSLASWLNIRALFIASVSPEGEGLEEHVRLSQLALAQRVFKQQERTVMVMDDANMAIWQASKEGKESWPQCYFNDSNVPCIWIADCMILADSEFLRHFNYVVVLNDEHQKAILESHKDKLQQLPVTLAYQHWLAQFKWLSPRLIARLLEYSLGLNPTKLRRNEYKISLYLRQLIGLDEIELTPDDYLPSYLNPKSVTGSGYQMPDYDVRWLNANLNINNILSNLKHSPSSSLCLHGQSGSGKSAFAELIAQATGKKIVRLTGSNFLSKFVGASEGKIAAHFSEAQRTGSILVLDEVDSLLISRDGSDLKSWEISHVNEMLTAIERFQGILMVTSNRFEHMDQAMTRRFDAKIRFEWMNSQQLRSLLEAILILNKKPREVERLNGIPDSILNSIHTSPGKVKAALRCLALQSTPLTARSLLAAVTEESRSDLEPQRRPIGFAPLADALMDC